MKTAVEWVEELIECGANLEQIKKCLPRAKEIFEEQIINCCIQTTQDCYTAIMEHLNAPLQFTDEDLSNQKLEAQQYYNETFKSE
jgi:hypothetical protein